MHHVAVTSACLDNPCPNVWPSRHVGYHKQTKAEPTGSDGQNFPFHSAVPSKVPIVPVPKAGSILPDWQSPPFSAAMLPKPTAGPPTAAPALSQGSNQASASHDSSPAVDLTSPNKKPRVAEPGVVDLTEDEVCLSAMTTDGPMVMVGPKT